MATYPAAARSVHNLLSRLLRSNSKSLVQLKPTLRTPSSRFCVNSPPHSGPHSHRFASSVAETGDLASSPSQSSPDLLPPELRPRMPAVPEARPKPTTAVAVVENYLDNLWRDFFTRPYNWFDNRLKRRAPKYADFKNRLTKEGLWITARWNPPWVRTELSLMTDFKPVPYDDPLWEAKRKQEEEESRVKPPPVAPGAWLMDELRAKTAKSPVSSSTHVASESAPPTAGSMQADTCQESDSMCNSTSAALPSTVS